MDIARLPLVLASASPRRLDLLARLGITPARVIATDIDETPLKAEVPRALAARLSRAKAEAALPLQKARWCWPPIPWWVLAGAFCPRAKPKPMRAIAWHCFPAGAIA